MIAGLLLIFTAPYITLLFACATTDAIAEDVVLGKGLRRCQYCILAQLMMQRCKLVHLVVKVRIAIEHAQRVVRIVLAMHSELPISTHVRIEDHFLEAVVGCKIVAVLVDILITISRHLLFQLHLALN